MKSMKENEEENHTHFVAKTMHVTSSMHVNMANVKQRNKKTKHRVESQHFLCTKNSRQTHTHTHAIDKH